MQTTQTTFTCKKNKVLIIVIYTRNGQKKILSETKKKYLALSNTFDISSE